MGGDGTAVRGASYSRPRGCIHNPRTDSLQLNPQREQIEVIAIDSAEKPSEN
jgi:hypothetical protein